MTTPLQTSNNSKPDADVPGLTEEQWDAMHGAFLSFTKRFPNAQSWSIQPEYVGVLFRYLLNAAFPNGLTEMARDGERIDQMLDWEHVILTITVRSAPIPGGIDYYPSTRAEIDVALGWNDADTAARSTGSVDND